MICFLQPLIIFMKNTDFYYDAVNGCVLKSCDAACYWWSKGMFGEMLSYVQLLALTKPVFCILLHFAFFSPPASRQPPTVSLVLLDFSFVRGRFFSPLLPSTSRRCVGVSHQFGDVTMLSAMKSFQWLYTNKTKVSLKGPHL